MDTIADIVRVFAKAQGGKMLSNVETSLYKRIGGYDVIAAFTDQWLGQGLMDPKLAV